MEIQMPQILFVVEIPPVPENSRGVCVTPGFSKFASVAAPKIKSVKGTKQLQSNAWLFPADNTLPLLAELAALAATNSCSLSYSAVLIPDGAVVLALDQKSQP